MDEIIRRIIGTQNKQKSLNWGANKLDEHEVVFAVGNRAYPAQTHFFSVRDDLSVHNLDNFRNTTLIKECKDVSEVLSCVIELLKAWYPARGVSDANS